MVMQSLVRRLRTKIEDIFCKMMGRNTPLVSAAWSREKDWVEAWLARGANVNFKGRDGKTALHWASINGDEFIVELLLANSAEVDVKDGTGITPLHIAAAYGDKIITDILLSKGASVSIRDKFGQTPLHKAAQKGFKVDEIVEEYDLLKAIWPDDFKRDKQRERDYGKVARVLLANKADINVKDNFLDTPLHKAALTGNKYLVKIFLDYGADINARDYVGATPLVCASVHSPAAYTVEEKKEIIELLLAKGAEINSKDNQGETPLHLSINYGFSKSSLDLMLSAGADIHAKDNNGYSPLHYAAGAGFSRFSAPDKGEESVVRRFIEKGADVNAKSSSGRVPLHFAAVFGYGGIIQILLDNGADVNVQDEVLGWTPLHEAVFNYRDSVPYSYQPDRYQITMDLLLQHGANVNIRDKKGSTPLHHAVYYLKGQALIKVLLAHGADLATRDNEGRTPVDIAASVRCPEILELLQKLVSK